MSTDTKARAPWEEATLSGAIRLLELLGKEVRSDAATVRRRFEDTTRDYEAHLSLLKVLGIAEQDPEETRNVGITRRESVARKEGRGANEGELARRLLSSRDEIGRHARALVARALRRDTTEKDERVRIYPTERNLLIEAGVLRVDPRKRPVRGDGGVARRVRERGLLPRAESDRTGRSTGAPSRDRAESRAGGAGVRARPSTGGGSSESHPCGG